MKCLTTGLFLLFLADSVVLGQPLHKNARLYVEAMSENLDSAIRAEIIRQRVPLRVVEVPGEAELIMKETSGFIGTQRHKEGIRLIIEIFTPAGSKRWPGAPGARFHWIEKASPGWQGNLAKRVVKKLSRVVKKLSRGVQRCPSLASSADNWWPTWSREKREERAHHAEGDKKPEQTARPTEASAPASARSTFRIPPAEVDVDWEAQDNTQVGIRFDQAPLEVQTGMSEEEVRNLFGDSLKIARLEDKTIYKYKDMVVEFQDGKVSEVKFL